MIVIGPFALTLLIFAYLFPRFTLLLASFICVVLAIGIIGGLHERAARVDRPDGVYVNQVECDGRGCVRWDGGDWRWELGR
jgi:cobalamin synthase